MKVSIIYHSETGNTEKVAKLIEESVCQIEGVKAESMAISEVDESFVNDSAIVFFGTPTYAGTYSWQMKKWLDTCRIKFAGKIGCVFATEKYIGGGADNAEMALISELLVKGMFAYSVGASEGQPYTHFGAVCIKDGTDEQKERVKIFAKRVTKKVKEMFGD
ncbi:MAG: flavodoxin family protein [Clostridia bacterium]|nr:flavodoxin family protein [Clostridia bacterium]